MSERTPTAPNPTLAEQQPPAEAPDQAPEQQPVSPDNATSHEILDHSDQLEETLGRSPRLENETHSKVSWRIRALNGKDRVQRHVTLQTARQYQMQGRVGRLERKLAKARPDSRRYMRINSALTRTKYQLGLVQDAQNKIFGRMYKRSSGHSDLIEKIARKEMAIDKLLAERRVAVEKKRRRKIKERHEKIEKRASKSKSYSQKERARLQEEIGSWNKAENKISTLKESLMAEVRKKYENRIKELWAH